MLQQKNVKFNVDEIKIVYFYILFIDILFIDGIYLYRYYFTYKFAFITSKPNNNIQYTINRNLFFLSNDSGAWSVLGWSIATSRFYTIVDYSSWWLIGSSWITWNSTSWCVSRSSSWGYLVSRIWRSNYTTLTKV